MDDINEILEKYYLAHQISKSVNILDIANMDQPNGTIKPLKCICAFLEPSEGWDKKINNALAEGEKCYYCSKQLAEKFSDYKNKIAKNKVSMPSALSETCQYCYWFCARKYISDTDSMRLSKKFIKISKMK